ncbi:MAG: hypothetical protein AAFZ87_18800, partial [Planctomycetota bacterium]
MRRPQQFDHQDTQIDVAVQNPPLLDPQYIQFTAPETEVSAPGEEPTIAHQHSNDTVQTTTHDHFDGASLRDADEVDDTATPFDHSMLDGSLADASDTDNTATPFTQPTVDHIE